MDDERRGQHHNDVRRISTARVRGRRLQATVALRQAVWIDVIEQISALSAENRELSELLGDAARCILDGFGLRAVAIGIVDGPWIEYRGVATERHSIAHRVQLQSSLSEVTGAPFPTELVVPADVNAGEDAPQTVTPLIRLPIRVGQRIAAALIVEIDQDQELDVDDIDALARIAQIIGNGLVRSEVDRQPRAGQAQLPTSQVQLDDPTRLLSLTPELVANWASRIDAGALRIVIDDWSGGWVVTGLGDGQPASETALIRLLAVPAVREARGSHAIQRLTELAESPEYDAASGTAGVAIVAPILVGDAPAGVVIAEFDTDAGTADVTAIAETVARLVERQRQRFNHLRAEQFVHVLDRVGHLNTLGLTGDEAYEALASVIHEVLGFDAGYGVIRGDRLHFLSPQRAGPIPAWFNDGIPLELGITGRVALTGREAFIPDVQETPEYLDLGDGALSEFCLPVYTGGELVGVFNVESTVRRLDALDAQLLRSAFGMVDAVLDDDEIASTVGSKPVEPRRGGMDPITGLPGDQYFYQRLADQLAVVRGTGLPASVFMVDVTLPEDAGTTAVVHDAVMREAGQRMVNQLRGEDLVAVRGGNRLMVLLPGVSAGASIMIGNRLVRSIEGKLLRLPGGESISARCSIGIATTAIGEESPEVLVVNAVMALERVLEGAQSSVGHYRDVEFGDMSGRD